MNGKRSWLGWVAAAVIAGVVLTSYFRVGNRSEAPAAGPAAMVGRPAASFTVLTPDGRRQSLATYRGRIVVLNLWASWCAPCRAEMPDLQRLYATYRSHNVVVLGVDQGESAERARAFAHSLGIRYPILVDKDQLYGSVYRGLGLPTTVIVDANGVVARGFDGQLSYDQMVAALRPLLTAK